MLGAATVSFAEQCRNVQNVKANKHNSHPFKIRDATETIQTTKRP
jgi:hypothetical protein